MRRAASARVILENFPQNQNVPIRIYQVGGYIQDDWKVNANLTISPALRIEHSSNPICVTNCFGQFAVPIRVMSSQTQPRPTTSSLQSAAEMRC